MRLFSSMRVSWSRHLVSVHFSFIMGDLTVLSKR